MADEVVRIAEDDPVPVMDFAVENLLRMDGAGDR